MQRLGLDVQNASVTVTGFAPCLLCQKSDGVALVQKPELSVGVLLGRRVQIDAPFDKVAMKVRNQ